MKLPENIKDLYIDQSIYNTKYEDIYFLSTYTPHGIKILESEYTSLIQNINIEVKEIHNINKDTLVSLDGNGYTGVGIDVVWSNNDERRFTIHIPKFDTTTRKTNPSLLKESIESNIHLHICMKENLLENLENYIKNDYKL